MKKSAPRIICATMAAALACGNSAAHSWTNKNLDQLAKLLAPAYTAMNFAVMCNSSDPTFSARMKGSRGNVVEYAQHVKDEVIERLLEGEAQFVLKAAADVARAIARSHLRQLARGRDTIAPLEIASWCSGPATEFIQGFIAGHDREHRAIEALIDEALR